MSESDVPFVFYFQAKRVGELRYILKREDFAYPVCIDTEDDFNNLNRLPNDMVFHAFLVDSLNRVKVIGNPVHNLSVKALYLDEITGTTSSLLPQTTVQTDSVEYHYGILDINETARKAIILRNTGELAFRINGVTASCDCMTVEYDWDSIPPGENRKMVVSYKAEEPGDFWRTIKIYGNIHGKSITIDFWGTVSDRAK